MRILVTGGSGFIGSVLVPLLLKEGHKVRVLDNLLFGQTSLFPLFINPDFEFIEGDVRNKEIVSNSLKDVDFIIHLAAIVGAPACKKDERLAWETNYEAAAYINEQRGNVPMIFPSTTSGYGTKTKVKGPCTEETEQSPISLYGKSKCEAEKAILSKGNAISYRFATGFGISPRLRLDLMPNDFVYKVVKNKNLVVFERHFRRAFIHVTDMAKSFVYGIKNFNSMKNQAYNTGSEDMNFTKEELCYRIKEKVNFALFFSDEDFDPDKRDYQLSFAKIKDKGFKLETTLNQGLDELIKAMRVLKIPSPFFNA